MDIGSILGQAGGAVASGGLSAIFGGITGLVGVWIRQRYELKKAEHDFELEKIRIADRKNERAHDLVVLQKEADTAEQRAKATYRENELMGDIKGFLASIKSDQAKYATADVLKSMTDGKLKSAVVFLLALVDVCRGMTRPVITWLSAYLVASVWWKVSGKLFAKIAEDKGASLLLATQSLNMIFYVAGMSIGWWFGSRPAKPPRDKGQSGAAAMMELPT